MIAASVRTLKLSSRDVTTHIARFLNEVAHLSNSEDTNMVEHTDDDWPDEYCDSHDRPQPDVPRVIVQVFDALQEDMIKVVEATAAGGSQPSV